MANKLRSNAVVRRQAIDKAASAPLAGRLFDDVGHAFSPSSGRGRGSRLYRYYITLELQRGAKRKSDDDRICRLSAPAVEQFVRNFVERFAGRSIELSELAQLIHRVEMRRDETHIVIEGVSLFAGEHPGLILNAVQTRLADGELAVAEQGQRGRIRIVLPHAMKLRGGDTWLHGAEVRRHKVNTGLVKALRRAHADLRALNASPLDLSAVCDAEAPATQHDRLVSRLAFLSPALQRRLLDGDLPANLTPKRFVDGSVPLAWAD